MTKGTLFIAGAIAYLGYRYISVDSETSLMDDLLSTGATLANVATTGSLPGSARDPDTGEDYSAFILAASRRYLVPAALLYYQLQQESRFRNRAVSPRGARGVAQFMPATAAEWGVNTSDPESSIIGQAKYMAWLYRQVGTWRNALAAYNWGIGSFKKYGISKVPKETRDYLRIIYDNHASELPP